MASLLNMSGGSLLGKGLPYDAEIEYLESTGTQYIQTDVYPHIGDVFSLDFTIQKTIDSTDFMYIAGYYTDFYNVCAIEMYTRNWNFIFSRQDYHWNDWPNYTMREKHRVQYNFDRNILIDGEVFKPDQQKNMGALRVEPNLPNGLRIFTLATSDQTLPSKVFHYAIILNDETVFDAIPVRVGQVGYMYDKVSKQLFGNSGTGAFILGPDKQ